MESSPETAVKKDKTSLTEVASTSTIAVATDSPPVRESPFSNFANNLSPINPVKGAHVAQGFLGLNSPPLVFASPSISIQREAHVLKRTMLQRLSNDELSQCSSEYKEVLKAPDDFNKCPTQGNNSSPTHNEEVLVAKGSLYVQPSISPGSVEEYFADPAEVECENSSYIVSPFSNKSDDGLQGHMPSSVENMPVLVSKEGLDGCLEAVDNGLQCISQQNNGTSVNIEEQQFHNECLSEQCPSDKLNFSEDFSLKKTQCEEGSSDQTTGGEHLVTCDMRPICPETFPESLSHESHGGNKSNSLALQQQRGFLRRCLQFDKVQTNLSRKNISTYLADEPTSCDVVATATEVDQPDLDHSNSILAVNQSPHVAFTVPPNHGGSSSLKPCKSSGILHLNSIVSTGQANPSDSSTTKLDDCPQALNLEAMSTETHHTLTELDIPSMPQCVGEKVSSSSEDWRHDSVSTVQDHAISVSCSDLEQLDRVKPIEQHATPLHKRKFNEEHADNLEELNQMSPTKKRKKTLGPFCNEGCKRCNCKKSQCLKLYCDCFAAGLYCAEPCTCQGCFNKPKYEVMVLEARQQIESRNPLAFAPKIVQNAKDNPAKNGEDGSRHTPSSARHKRGCNCKKSMCQKKYCECYQANVGCSDNCRCEGCKNVYGRKEDYGMPEEICLGIHCGSVEVVNDEKLAISGTKKDYIQEIYHPGNMTPLTPSLQCSDHGKGPPRSRIIPSKQIISPDVGLTAPSCSAKSIRPEKGSGSIKELPDGTKEVLEVGSVFQVSDDNMDTTAAEQTHGSRIPLYPGSGQAQTGNSLRWRSSPISVTQLRGTKSQMDVKSDVKLHDSLEDDTPDILMDTSTPTTSVKNNSPNRKRVSPPHSRMHVIGSTSSAGVKISRKFILQAVPSFPPLTPCISREGSPNKKSDLQDRGRNYD